MAQTEFCSSRWCLETGKAPTELSVTSATFLRVKWSSSPPVNCHLSPPLLLSPGTLAPHAPNKPPFLCRKKDTVSILFVSFHLQRRCLWSLFLLSGPINSQGAQDQPAADLAACWSATPGECHPWRTPLQASPRDWHAFNTMGTSVHRCISTYMYC